MLLSSPRTQAGPLGTPYGLQLFWPTNAISNTLFPIRAMATPLPDGIKFANFKTLQPYEGRVRDFETQRTYDKIFAISNRQGYIAVT